MEIREYHPHDEIGWVRCRVLSFLDTAYFDHVLQKKEKYENPSIELVAVIEGQVVGLLDIEYERMEGTVCSRGTGLGGMIWHVAVHPDFRRKRIGKRLLQEAERKAMEKNLNRLEAWTRDDDWVNKWYEKNGFHKVNSYLHVYLNKIELEGNIKSELPNLLPVQAFTHYVGEDKEKMKSKFNRVHECVCYEKELGGFK
ncbi:GNAT family N-acetyltransferase [Virgibacillus soli]|uniref:GNAT family N-acetyltransferase n=1 Tax=Paracerasibacillus soli TaxID=480284 RepID=UPI0035E9F6B4